MGLPEGSPENYNLFYEMYRKHQKDRKRKHGESKVYQYGQQTNSFAGRTSLSNRSIGVPDRTKFKLNYARQLIVDLVSTTWAATVQFRINDLFLPDANGAGHQPMFYDQLTAMYNRFQVRGARISVKFTNFSSSPIILAMCPSQAATIATKDPYQLGERPGSVIRHIPPSTQYDSSATINMYYDIAKIVGMTPDEYSKSYDFSHFNSGSPAAPVFWTMRMLGLNLTGTINCRVDTYITFYAEAFEKRRNLASS